MTSRRARAIAASLTAAALAGACSGSDRPEVQPPLESAEPLTPLTTTTTDSPPPTATPVDSTLDDVDVDPTTTPAPTTSTTTTTTTTEPAPTTTTLEDLRQEIEADLDAAEKAIIALGDNPGSPETQEKLALYRSGAALQSTRDTFLRAATNGVRFRARDDLPSSLEILEPPLVVSATEVQILTCRIDAAVGYQTLPDGTEDVTADTVLRTISNVFAVLEDGVWKLGGGDRISRDEGITTCE